MLDHGTLNLPLSKRGNIDSQIDRYKADLERSEKARRASVREEKARAKALFVEIGEEVVSAYVGKLGSAKEIRAMLDQMVKWEPVKFLAIAAKFQVEQTISKARGED
jgi:hypothetical protein